MPYSLNTTVLMCEPKFYDVNYEINPWMDTENKVDYDLAQKQWQSLKKIIESLGSEVKLVEPSPNLPDLVFTDGGFVYKDIFIPSHFKFAERRPEAEVYADWFKDNGYKIKRVKSNHFFEGHGDNLWVGDTVYCGVGFRSDKEAYQEIKDLIKDSGDVEFVLIDLIDEKFYHIDTCFCPVSEDLALIYRPGISPDSLKILEERFELIDVPEVEANQFACNSLVIGKNVILPGNNLETEKKLIQKGFKTFSCDVSEFMKAGGAVKCMSLPMS